MSIEKYFVSEDFFNIILSFKNVINTSNPENIIELIEYLISSGIKYSILLSDKKLSSDGITPFLTKVSNYIKNNHITVRLYGQNPSLELYIRNLYAEELLKKNNLNNSDLKNPQVRTKFYKYIVEKITFSNFKFHAFNSTFLKSIKKYGINPYIQFTPQKEIDKINNIFIKHGIYEIFGYQKINCEGQISYSEKPSVSYHYSINSPEWFSQFTSQSFIYRPFNKYFKNTYIENDYISSKENLLSIMKEHQFTPKEQQEVLTFFENNWHKYADNIPMLAIVPYKKQNLELIAKILSYIEKSDECQTNFVSTIGYITSSYDNCFNDILLDSNVDCQTKEIIDVKNATFLELPKYYDVMVTLADSKKLKKSIQKN